MDTETIRTEVSELAFGYVLAGELSEDWLSGHLAPPVLPDRFREYNQLTDVHFCLHPVVAEFAQNLRPHLREIKTETRTEQYRGRDEIKGRINWPETYRARYNELPADRSLFVTTQRTEEYDIAENLVLKELLSVIYKTVSGLEDLDADWIDERWDRDSTEGDKIKQFKQLYERNIHLNRITTPEGSLPDDRMIQTAKSARHKLYRHAAKCLEWRRELLNKERTALEPLFNSTLIQPNEDRLFELFVVFRLLQALEERFGSRGSLRALTGGGNAIASIGDPPCYVYHDSSGRDRGLRFPPMPAPESSTDASFGNEITRSEWVNRSEAVQHWFDSITSELWESDTNNVTGRPDCIFFRPAPKDSDRFASELLIVEVKNSTRKKTINRGIAETLQYLAYATKLLSQEKFLFPESTDEDAFGRDVHGLVVIQDLKSKSVGSISGPLEVVQASNLKEQLPRILANQAENTEEK